MKNFQPLKNLQPLRNFQPLKKLLDIKALPAAVELPAIKKTKEGIGRVNLDLKIMTHEFLVIF